MLDNYKLSQSQMNIALAHNYYDKMPIYTLTASLYIYDDVDIIKFKNSVDTVIKSNDIFNIKIVEKNDEFTQIYDESISSTCNIVDNISFDEVKNTLFKRKYEYIDFSESLYDFTIYKTEKQTILNLKIHHILIDGFSIGKIFNEITSIYEGKKVGNKSKFLKNYDMHLNDCDKQFWENYLKDIHYYKNQFQCGVGAKLASVFSVDISEELSFKINDFASKNNIRPYSIFASALSIYLKIIQDSEDVIFTLPRLNRSENTVSINGCFVLPIALRICTKGSFLKLCKSVIENGRIASNHKNYGFSNILNLLKSTLDNQNFLPYTLNFQKSKIQTNLNIKFEFSSCGAMPNLITLNVCDYANNGNFHIDFDYREDIISCDYMKFFSNSIIDIISQGINDNNNIDEINIISDEENNYLNSKLCGEFIDINKNENIVTIFDKICDQYPNDTAVITDEKVLTFIQLQKVSNKIANSIKNKGISENSLISFKLSRNYKMVPCILGILKSGCGFLPIDIKSPSYRTDFIIKDSCSKLFITDENIDDLMNFDDESSPNINVDLGKIAYCIYTSGTTGNPKGVLINHLGILNIVNEKSNPFNRDIVKDGNGIIAIGSIAFDISIFEIFVMLLNKKYIFLANDDILADPQQLGNRILKHDINIIHSTPSRIIEYIKDENFKDALTNIDFILSAGEVLTKELSNTLKNEFNIKIYNGYGPTEVTIGVTITEPFDNKSIGKPIGNTGIFILNKNNNILPAFAKGEICVYGYGVAIGYLNNDKLNKEKFVSVYGEKVYKTGDIGYLDFDGKLIFIGRNDNQIKLRGLRIELSEIENIVLNYEGIKNCKALVINKNNTGHLALFYTSDTEEDKESIKKYLFKNLIYYMVPDIFIYIKDMPLNINGKVDTNKLLEMDINYKNEYISPSTQEEKIVCEAFQYALGIENVGIKDNFFELSGTSLLASKVMVYLKKNNIKVQYSDIFSYPTPELLSKNLSKNIVYNFYDEIAYLDYKKVNEEINKSGNKVKMKNILLTGATGYLGAHILDEILKLKEDIKIYCVVRNSGKVDAKRRLMSKLFYYFDGEHIDKLDKQIFVVDCDLNDENLLEKLNFQIDTVINSSAKVSHFAYGDILSKANIDTVKNLINICEVKGATLIQISTISVCGMSKNPKSFNEKDLFIGQSIFNQYIYTKYIAEYEIILASYEKGIDFKIMRVGNLQGRLSDGEFQMNLKQNAFAMQIREYCQLKVAPISIKDVGVPFSPVDETAKAILVLCETEGRIYHISCDFTVSFDTLFSHTRSLGKDVEYISDSKFWDILDKYSKDDVLYEKVQYILTHRSDIDMYDNLVNVIYSVEKLNENGFYYKNIDDVYLKRYFNSIDSLGFFDTEGEL